MIGKADLDCVLSQIYLPSYLGALPSKRQAKKKALDEVGRNGEGGARMKGEQSGGKPKMEGAGE